jgi:release factor glutamine methyltransferase
LPSWSVIVNGPRTIRGPFSYGVMTASSGMQPRYPQMAVLQTPAFLRRRGPGRPRGMRAHAIAAEHRSSTRGRRFGPVTRFGELWLVTPPGVFAPRSDAAMLLEAAAGRLHGRVLDLCTGSGVLALSVQPHAEHVTAVDESRRAVAAVHANAALNRRPVEVHRGDLFEPVAGRLFDVIVSNPPYLPAADDGRGRGSRAWNGGHDGRRVIDRICRAAAGHLAPGGELLLVQSSLTRVGPTLELLEQSGLRAAVVASHTGPVGPLARIALHHLRQMGAAPRDETTEQVVVISGRRRDQAQARARARARGTDGLDSSR